MTSTLRSKLATAKEIDLSITSASSIPRFIVPKSSSEKRSPSLCGATPRSNQTPDTVTHDGIVFQQHEIDILKKLNVSPKELTALTLPELNALNGLVSTQERIDDTLATCSRSLETNRQTLNAAKDVEKKLASFSNSHTAKVPVGTGTDDPVPPPKPSVLDIAHPAPTTPWNQRVRSDPCTTRTASIRLTATCSSCICVLSCCRVLRIASFTHAMWSCSKLPSRAWSTGPMIDWNDIMCPTQCDFAVSLASSGSPDPLHGAFST